MAVPVTDLIATVDQPLSPTAQAADLRAKAATLDGSGRDYFLWLATEWDKTAARHGAALLGGEHRAASSRRSFH